MNSEKNLPKEMDISNDRINIHGGASMFTLGSQHTR